jgi:phage terminase large subunit
MVGQSQRAQPSSASSLKIECVNKLGVLLTKPKRIKILVGGRASTKSTFVSDYVLSRINTGERWCCSREYQNSIDDSVHSLLCDEIDRCGFEGFNPARAEINHVSGGKAFYRGLARNITSLKGINAHGLWIEEGESLSKATLKILTASIRISAKDAQDYREHGLEARIPEIWITMNRGSSKDPIAQKFLARAEKELSKSGYYEDDTIMVVQINYTDNPWFKESGLEQERLDDHEHMTTAEYDHKWHGAYGDSIDGAIIRPEWFDACVDAHKLERLKKVFTPHGALIAAHDPSDEGADDKGYACRHGSIIKHVKAKPTGEIDEGCDWATGLAIQHGASWFVWDGDGMGAGLKRQVSTAFSGTMIKYHMFRGSLSGKGQDNAEKIYQPQYGDEDTNPKTYQETFKNNRSQYYTMLAMRCYNTYRCVVKGEYVDPDEMISFDSEGIDDLVGLRSQMCRIPRKENPNGLIQIMNKKDMKILEIDSPNETDSVMMCLFVPPLPKQKLEPLDYPPMSIV